MGFGFGFGLGLGLGFRVRGKKAATLASALAFFFASAARLACLSCLSFRPCSSLTWSGVRVGLGGRGRGRVER